MKTKVRKPVEKLTVADVEKAIGVPATRWEGNCYSIATKIVEAGLVGGAAVYGHYTGPISRHGYWKDRVNNSIVRHGWILLKDGRILDPTRWSFEAKDPYLALIEPGLGVVCGCGHVVEEHGHGFFSPCEACSCPDFQAEPDPYDDYDEGGNRFYESNLKPCPAFDGSQRVVSLKLKGGAAHLVKSLMPHKELKISLGQAFWLANLPVGKLHPHAVTVYEAFKEAGYNSLVPIDNLAMAKREAS